MCIRPPQRVNILVVLLVEERRRGRHPLHVARTDDPRVPRIVAVRDRPFPGER